MEVIEFFKNSFSVDEMVLVGLGAYELVVRRKKTSKNYSLFSLIGKIFKNRKKDGGEFK